MLRSSGIIRKLVNLVGGLFMTQLSFMSRIRASFTNLKHQQRQNKNKNFDDPGKSISEVCNLEEVLHKLLTD